MSVRSLGYIVLGVSDVAAWRAYATDILGAPVTDMDDGLRVRVDSRDWRIDVQPSGEDDIIAAGWEVASPEALTALVEQLTRADIEVTVDAGLAAQRGVRGLARFVDPAGLQGELFWGATERFERPFVSPVGVSGFVTGDQGLGHLVLAAKDPAAMQRFYLDLLGFRVSDFIDIAIGPGRVLPVEFLHCNARHHTVAFAPAPSPKILLHFMLEVQSIDDVGFALDRIAAKGVGLSMTLGRHVNDHMLSFYAYTPSGFEVEYGWGARTIDDATWLPVRHDRISIWGHTGVGQPGKPQV